jgi:hypothetical protein
VARKLLGAIVCLLLAGPAGAGSRGAAESHFREGLRLYEEERVVEALAEWREVLAEGYVSPDLYLNLGNASYRAGETGWAVYYYEMARRRMPGDPDVAGNLALARREALGGEPPSASSPWLLEAIGWLDHLSLGGAARFAAAALWVAALLVGATWIARLQRVARLRPRALRWAALGLLVAAGLLVGLKAAQQSVAADAIAVKPLTAHTEPSEDAAVEFRLPEGSPVGLGRRALGWREVIVSHSLRGWVLEDAVAVL